MFAKTWLGLVLVLALELLLMPVQVLLYGFLLWLSDVQATLAYFRSYRERR